MIDLAEAYLSDRRIAPMTFDQFREAIRVGVVAGMYDVKAVVTLINRHGWNTTRDVPADERDYILNMLDVQAVG